MKVMLNNRQAEWIMRNVYPIMDFDEVVKFGSIMDRFHQGQYAVFFDIDFLKRIIELGIVHELVRYPMFYELCNKYDLAIQRGEKKQELFCIRFDYSNDVGMKIRCIKALRELIRNEKFQLLVGRIFDDGLKACKDFVETGACIGPYSLDTITKIKYMIDGGCSYSVIPYNKTQTFIS